MDINEMVKKKIEEDKYKKLQQELEEEIQEFNKKTKEQLEKDLMFSYFEKDFIKQCKNTRDSSTRRVLVMRLCTRRV